MSRWLATAALFLLCQTAAGAQAVRGVVVDGSDHPVAGVVVVLVDGASREVARTLTGESGAFRLAAPTAGFYRVRTLRIGFRSNTSDRIELRANDEVTQRLALSSVPFSLDTIRTSGRNACRVIAKDSVSAMFALWEQVRTALAATQLTGQSRTLLVTTEGYDRTLDRAQRRIRQQTTDFRTDYVTQPWRSLSPDSLRRVGYVVTEAGDFRVYYAPGLDALLSATFLEDHCLRIGQSGDASRLTIAFEPTPDRSKVPEIRGTLSLDRASSELRSMTFGYVNVPIEERQTAGGDMEFVRMRNGMWAISRWNIRMPTIVLVPVYRNTRSGLAEVGKEARVDSIKVTGGELVVAALSTSKGRDTLWSRPRLVLSGTVLDSVSGAPIERATVDVSGTALQASTDRRGRFSIPDLLPGRYILDVHTPSLDSLDTVNQSTVLFADSTSTIQIRVPSAGQIATSLCGNAALLARGSREGILIGTVDMPGDTTPPKGAKVVAHWTEVVVHGPVVTNEPRVSDAVSDSHGTFRMCGIPVNTTLTLFATTDSASSNVQAAKISGDVRFARADLTLDQKTVTGGVLIGIVVTDTTNRAVVDAEVSFPELTLSTRTDDQGAFRLSGIPAGSQHVIVRRLGFGALDAQIEFGKNQTLNRRIVLNRITVLDSSLTTAARRDPGMEDFEVNRRLGLGHFVTRADIDKQVNSSVSDMIAQFPGVRLGRGNQGQAWVVSRRSWKSIMPFECQPLEGSSPKVCSTECFAQVWLDNAPIVQQKGIININTFQLLQVEAIEYYAGGAETPPRYAVLNSQCGVIVIHKRRPP
jgi:carboxypeptidase family protein